MKKIILTLALVAFGTMSAHALDRSDLSVTGGFALNSGVFGASAKETNLTDTNTADHIKKESGVFTDNYQSAFIELGVGSFVSLGYEHTTDSITTPTQTTREGKDAEASFSVDFNDLNTMYATVNLGSTGVYAKYGFTEMDTAIKKTGNSSSYSNVSIDGTVMGVGYKKSIRDSRIGIRIEGAYYEFDNATTSNGVAADGGSPANGGRNQIDASNLEGLQGKIAVTFTLGNN